MTSEHLKKMVIVGLPEKNSLSGPFHNKTLFLGYEGHDEPIWPKQLDHLDLLGKERDEEAAAMAEMKNCLFSTWLPPSCNVGSLGHHDPAPSVLAAAINKVVGGKPLVNQV